MGEAASLRARRSLGACKWEASKLVRAAGGEQGNQGGTVELRARISMHVRIYFRDLLAGSGKARVR